MEKPGDTCCGVAHLQCQRSLRENTPVFAPRGQQTIALRTNEVHCPLLPVKVYQDITGSRAQATRLLPDANSQIRWLQQRRSSPPDQNGDPEALYCFGGVGLSLGCRFADHLCDLEQDTRPTSLLWEIRAIDLTQPP